MTSSEVMKELKRMGTDQTRKIWISHGVSGDFYGVKIGDMKVLQKKIKKDHDLALALFDTGNADAMYFAGLISDPGKMTKDQLQHWADMATWKMLSEYSVSWVAAESRYGKDMAMRWITSSNEHVAAAGWRTYSCLLALKNDDNLDLVEVKGLLEKISKTIFGMPNRVRYSMNAFVIAAGSYVLPCNALAKEVARVIGPTNVDNGKTASKIPDA